MEEADSTATWFYHDLSLKVKTQVLKWVMKGQTPKIEVYEHQASALYDTGGEEVIASTVYASTTILAHKFFHSIIL